MSDTAVRSPSPPVDEIRRVRDLARRHGFAVSIRDAEAILAGLLQSRGGGLILPAADAELFMLLMEPLHQWLAENGDPAPPVKAEPEGRPLLIDENDGPCEICAGWNARKYLTDPVTGQNLGFRCDECGEKIEEFNPTLRGRGCDGVRPHHYHLQGIGPSGVRGRSGRWQELCLECYVVHRQKIYPAETAELIRQKCRNH